MCGQKDPFAADQPCFAVRSAKRYCHGTLGRRRRYDGDIVVDPGHEATRSTQPYLHAYLAIKNPTLAHFRR